MNKRYDEFRKTPLGMSIEGVIRQDGRPSEFAAFTREGFPAITAVVSLLTPLLAELKETDRAAFNFAKQFAGDVVGDVMRENGYEKIQDGKNVPGKLFAGAAHWGLKA